MDEKPGKKHKRIPADLSQIAPNTSYSDPPLSYQDMEFTCEVCGKQEVWTAEEQKWWYEVAKGHLFTRATRCRDCRKAAREAHQGAPRRSLVERNQVNAERIRKKRKARE